MDFFGCLILPNLREETLYLMDQTPAFYVQSFSYDKETDKHVFIIDKIEK